MNEDELRTRIIRSIEECEDKSLKVVLLLMLEVLDSIGKKIDTILRDEETLRDLVLNGDANTHAKEHDDWRNFHREWTKVKDQLSPITQCHTHSGYCLWAAEKMKKEQADAESRRKIRDNWLVHVAWALTTIITGALVAKYLG